jgi:hypothetical protein
LSLALREEHRRYEDRMLRRIYGPKRDETVGSSRKFHNEESRNVYSLSYIIRMIKSRRMRSTVHGAHIPEKRYAYKVQKPSGKILLGRPRRRWEDNIKIDVRETGWDGMDWSHLAQDRNQWRTVVHTVTNLRVP